MKAQNLAGGGMVWRGIHMAAMSGVMPVSSIVAISYTKKETDRNPRVIQQEGFMVVGIAVRTSNAKEMMPQGAIGKQWGRLMGEGLLEKIPNKADENIVAVYTEYASDKDGEYTYLLGARVSKAEGIPAGMVAQSVPSGKYALFTSDEGPVQNVVVAMWQRVWATPKSAPGGDRAYKTDYEVYDQRARNPANAVVDLYLSIR